MNQLDVIPCCFTAFQARSKDMCHNLFVLWVLLIQANASIGDAAFQSADVGEKGLKQCLVGVYLSIKSQNIL